MDPDLAKRVSAITVPSPFVLQSSALHSGDDAEDVRVCSQFVVSVTLLLL